MSRSWLVRAPWVVVAALITGCGSGRPLHHPPLERLHLDGKRTLVVVMDAVPFAALEALTDDDGERLFEFVGRPVPLISSFPSTTTLALTGVFEPIGLEPPPGYEAKFFDRTAGKVRGGGLISYQRIPFSWRSFFDWKTKGLLAKAFSYVSPGRWSRKEVRRGIRAFLESKEEVFFVYVGATDGVSHLRGPAAFEPTFRTLDEELRRARALEDFYVVVLSDHGIGPLDPKPPPLRNTRKRIRHELREAGYSLRAKWERGGRESTRRTGPRPVRLVPFGLVSSFVAFSADESDEPLAEVLSGTEGVGLCATAARSAGDTAAWIVRDGEQAARIERRLGSNQDEWRYVPRAGDPLGYDDLAGVWRTGEEWLEQTGSARYPDALHRIARAFDLVRNRASAVCSVEPGWMFGAAVTEHTGRLTVGRLRWTHGALDYPDSAGFFLTDHPALERTLPVRFDRALAPLGPSTLRDDADATTSPTGGRHTAQAPVVSPEHER